MTTFSGIHALIVEDDASSVDVLIDLFRQLKVSYTTLFDNRNVVPMMQQLGKVDVVFLDLEMPNNNGYEVLSAIREIPEFAAIPVVAYTSHNSEMANARDAGFHSFLGKPLRGKEFAEQLAKILNHESVWAVR
jgi:CheY-like chemotaxis protein